MVIKLYLDYMSQPARSVLALCIAGNIPHEVIEVRVFKGEVKYALLRIELLNMPRSIPCVWCLQ